LGVIYIKEPKKKKKKKKKKNKKNLVIDHTRNWVKESIRLGRGGLADMDVECDREGQSLYNKNGVYLQNGSVLRHH